MNIRRVTCASKLVPASNSLHDISSGCNMLDHISSTYLKIDRKSPFQTAFGQYQFPDGMVYEGGMCNGRFNRAGKLLFKSGARIQGEWLDDACVNSEYIFSDGLKFKEANWKYCTSLDRRCIPLITYTHSTPLLSESLCDCDFCLPTDTMRKLLIARRSAHIPSHPSDTVHPRCQPDAITPERVTTIRRQSACTD